MAMTTIIVLIVAIGALGALYVLITEARQYRKWRGDRVVTCPETHAPAAVTVDATHAAVSALTHAPDLRLKQCSRWPERRECGQECLRQIELAPEDCLVRNILTQWYEGKSCALCGERFGAIQSWENKPGFLSADGTALTLCSEVPGEKLPEVLQTQRPVCWNCYIAEEFRRRNPDLVTDWPAGVRPRHAGEG
jgi:hypothetical protein